MRIALVLLFAAACGGSSSKSPGSDGGALTHPADGSVVATTDGGGTSDLAVSPTCTSGPIDPNTAPMTIDTNCMTPTFVDDFMNYDISSGPTDDGLHPNEKWFNATEQCCLSTSDGKGTAMYPTQANGTTVNPYSLIAGGGLDITASVTNDTWVSGVMTSVDSSGKGFSQMYGYFEMSAQLAPGSGTWPSFWMRSMPYGSGDGEIDIFEQYGCNPPYDPGNGRILHFTLHDWATNDGVAYPPDGTDEMLPDLTADQHRYGLLWSANYLAMYVDGKLLGSLPPYDVMKGRAYYMLADMGIGGGWDTSQTPSPSTLAIKYIHAYSVAGF